MLQAIHKACSICAACAAAETLCLSQQSGLINCIVAEAKNQLERLSLLLVQLINFKTQLEPENDASHQMPHLHQILQFSGIFSQILGCVRLGTGCNPCPGIHPPPGLIGFCFGRRTSENASGTLTLLSPMFQCTWQACTTNPKSLFDVVSGICNPREICVSISLFSHCPQKTNCLISMQ